MTDVAKRGLGLKKRRSDNNCMHDCFMQSDDHNYLNIKLICIPNNSV